MYVGVECELIVEGYGLNATNGIVVAQAGLCGDADALAVDSMWAAQAAELWHVFRPNWTSNGTVSAYPTGVTNLHNPGNLR